MNRLSHLNLCFNGYICAPRSEFFQRPINIDIPSPRTTSPASDSTFPLIFQFPWLQGFTSTTEPRQDQHTVAPFTMSKHPMTSQGNQTAIILHLSRRTSMDQIYPDSPKPTHRMFNAEAQNAQNRLIKRTSILKVQWGSALVRNPSPETLSDSQRIFYWQ